MWSLGIASENKGGLCTGVGNVILFSSQYLLKFPSKATLQGPRKQREDRRFEMGGNKKYEVAKGMCFSFAMLGTQPDLCSVSADGFLYPNGAVAMLLLCI